MNSPLPVYIRFAMTVLVSFIVTLRQLLFLTLFYISIATFNIYTCSSVLVVCKGSLNQFDMGIMGYRPTNLAEGYY